MKIPNYMSLNQVLIWLNFLRDRTGSFREIHHAHQGMEMLYIHEGNGTVMIEDRMYEVERGTFLYFKPYQLHHVKFDTGPGQPYLRSMFIFEPHILDKFLTPFPSLRDMLSQMVHDPALSQIIRVQNPLELESLINLHRPRIDQARPAELLELQALFLVSLLAVLRHQWADKARHVGMPAPVRTTSEQVIHWIDQHFAEPFHLESLAKSMHLSASHVSAMFRRNVGISLTDYLIAKRVREASLLLQTSSLPVQSIGEQVGITNFSYFCQMFKKHVGLTPHQYRKAHSGMQTSKKPASQPVR